MLMIVPLFMAGGNIAVRTLRGMNLHAISIYFSLSSILAYGYVIIAFKMDLEFLHDFNKTDWIILTLSAIMSLSNLMLKQQAMRFETASRVTMYNYFSAVF